MHNKTIVFIFVLFLSVSGILQAKQNNQDHIPNNAYPSYLEGIRALKTHRTTEAIKALEQAAIVAPKNGKIHWELGWAYWQDQYK